MLDAARMLNVSVSRRYARALAEVAGAQSDTALAQLSALVDLLEQHPELRQVATDPAYSSVQRMAVMEAVLKELKAADTLFGNFVRLLVQRNRLVYLPDILRLYREQADARAGRVRGRITSAKPLPDASVKAIEKALEALTQRNVVVETRVDPKLLGGVQAQVGSMLYDGSLRAQLEDMRRTLAR